MNTEQTWLIKRTLRADKNLFLRAYYNNFFWYTLFKRNETNAELKYYGNYSCSETFSLLGTIFLTGTFKKKKKCLAC